MRKREVVKIDEKEYTIKELTVREIIEIFSDSDFFKEKMKEDGEVKNTGGTYFDELKDMLSILERVLSYCSDFKLEDLKELAPSEIKNLYNKFEEVNKDFLSFAEVMGAKEMLINIRETVVNNFSRTLAISLNQAM